MTGQGLLDRMELLNQELQLQSGEADVTRGLLALNVAQDFFETLAASRGKIFAGSVGTFNTTAVTETTTFPSGVLRIDRLQALNSSSLPARELVPLRRAGGHAGHTVWPLNYLIGQGDGNPTHYWTNGTNIYWSPRPASQETIRYYGFAAASDITAGGTFAYPDIVALPLAAFSVQVLRIGLDDDIGDVGSLAQSTFNPVLDTLSAFNRDGAVGLEYTEVHDA